MKVALKFVPCLDRLIRVLKTYIKLSIRKNIFLKIKKLIIIFLIFEKKFSKMEIIVCPKGTH